jgi:hypothetical protein
MKPSSRFIGSVLVLVISLIAAAPVLADINEWKPVDPAQLAQKAPQVEKDADAEVIFWDVRVRPEGEGAALSHYIRIKIFTERGCESQGKVEFTHLGGKLGEVAGRTIKVSGQILDLRPSDIFNRPVAQAHKLNLESTSFALPGVEPGAIIEYRWREELKSPFIYLQFQKSIPVQSVTYHLPTQMRYRAFNMPNLYIQTEEKNFYSASLTNVPAYRIEPYMPPSGMVSPWLLISRTGFSEFLFPSMFWQEFGRRVYEENKSHMKVGDEVRRAAVAAMGDAATPEKKIERLFEFCRSKIKNVDDGATTEAERAAYKDNKTPADTLKRGVGSNKDINLLFAALATAAGFDTRYAVLADRSKVFFDPKQTDFFFLDCYDIAVRMGQDWRFFDPSSTYVPFCMLRWQEEGTYALLVGPEQSVFVKTPLSAPEKSLEKRAAMLRLHEDGALEGDVRVEYTGHVAAGLKMYYDDESPEGREKLLREELKKHIGPAEFSDIRVENVTDPIKPFACSYHVSFPGYAQRTGKRLFLRPAFFQYGEKTLFPTSERRHPIYFNYAWSEEDTVTIELPAGFTLDSNAAPEPLTAGNGSTVEVSRYDAKVEIIKDGRGIKYNRSFVFGGSGGSIFFPTESYAQLKQVFDAIHQRDSHILTLSQGGLATKQGDKTGL